jgi:hypothetical protein
MEKAVYEVTDLMILLSVGRNKAYDLIKQNLFPVRVLGRRYIIPKKPFEEWLNGKTLNNE